MSSKISEKANLDQASCKLLTLTWTDLGNINSEFQ